MKTNTDAFTGVAEAQAAAFETQKPASGTPAQAMIYDTRPCARRWWTVECNDRGTVYSIGGEHYSLSVAQRFLKNCITPQRLRNKCRIILHEELVSEAALK